MCVSLSVCVCACVSLCLCVCAFVCIFVCVCVCVWLVVCVSVWVRACVRIDCSIDYSGLGDSSPVCVWLVVCVCVCVRAYVCVCIDCSIDYDGLGESSESWGAPRSPCSPDTWPPWRVGAPGRHSDCHRRYTGLEGGGHTHHQYTHLLGGGFWESLCGRPFRPPAAPLTVFIWSAVRLLTSLYIVTVSLNTVMALKSSGTTCAVGGCTDNRTQLNI